MKVKTYILLFMSQGVASKQSLYVILMQIHLSTVETNQMTQVDMQLM